MLLKRRAKIIAMVLVGFVLLAVGLMFRFYSNEENPASTVQALPEPDRYTVRSGDSLYFIAGKWGLSVPELKQANSLDSDLIIPGQVLAIPDGLSSGSNRYTVKSGDCLFEIAGKYGITVDSLKKANALPAELITPGQVLIIPEASSVSEVPGTTPVPSPVSKPSPSPSPSPAGREQEVAERPLGEILAEKGITDPWSEMKIVIDKSDHILWLVADGIWLKSYHVELGDGGTGDKQVQGDHKTPEGTFYIAEKSVFDQSDQFLGSRWMRLSYPNNEDAQRGIRQGLIDQETYDEIVTAFSNKQTPPQQTALGGGVGIHGGSTPELGSNWTWGCIGLNNRDVEDFYNFVTVGTPVIIQS
jgi:LysM repeat protein